MPELWAAIATSYEAANYSHAVLDAVHYLTTVIRDRSGCDGDGAALVGQAFGGDAPKLRLNNLNTESERNVQKGFEMLLRGLYTAIRNPRSHEQSKDTRQDADAIIHFVDYIVRVLNVSKQAFTVESFLAAIRDPEFVESARYAELLTSEIPVNRRGEAITELFKVRRTVEIRKLRHVIESLLNSLNEAQLAQYLQHVSEELRVTTEDASIRTALQMLTPDIWPQVAETSRLRVENKLIRTVVDGEILADGKTTGSLGTWANSFAKNFTLRDELAEVLISKLEDVDPDDRRYVAKYYLSRIPEIVIGDRYRRRTVAAIAEQIKEGDSHIRERLIKSIRRFPAKWQAELAEALTDETDPSNPAVLLEDGTPFLQAPTSTEITEEDIPF